MGLVEYIQQFRELHEKMKAARLSPEEKAQYENARDELARILLNVTRASLPDRFSPRKALRMPIQLRIELNLDGVLLLGTTTDVGTGGCGVLVTDPLPLDSVKDKVIEFSLFLIGQPKPVVGHARIVNVVPREAMKRLAIAFEGLSEFEQKRVQLTVWDKVLELF